jgi:hypothetical protein
MRFYAQQHPCYCGIALHARTMDVCILRHAGAMVVPRDMPASPETFLQAMAPYREAIVVAVEGIVTWSWLADVCARAGLSCVLGQALSMKAIHGGTATNDRLDARQSAVLRRGGMLPQAYVSPAALRATRDRLRRRVHLTRTRAELLPHIQQTNRPDTLPARGQTMADKGNRNGGAERLPEPVVHQRGAVALALMAFYDP